MFESIFDLPSAVTAPAIIVSLCSYSVVGLLVVRRHVLPQLRWGEGESEFTGAMLHSVMVVYGLAVALISVTVFETYADTQKVVTGEATALNALYRDVSSYPDPIRQSLQEELRDYTVQIINQAWPLQRRGQVPSAGIEYMSRFQAALTKFDPATDGQKILHAETLRAYNLLIEARRRRLDAVVTGLPGVMWAVVLVGAVIGLSASFFFRVTDARLHAIEVVLLSLFVGLIIFMIVALDRPFRGDLGVKADAYQLLYDQLMKPAP